MTTKITKKIINIENYKDAVKDFCAPFKIIFLFFDKIIIDVAPEFFALGVDFQKMFEIFLNFENLRAHEHDKVFIFAQQMLLFWQFGLFFYTLNRNKIMSLHEDIKSLDILFLNNWFNSLYFLSLFYDASFFDFDKPTIVLTSEAYRKMILDILFKNTIYAFFLPVYSVYFHNYKSFSNILSHSEYVAKFRSCSLYGVSQRSPEFACFVYTKFKEVEEKVNLIMNKFFFSNPYLYEFDFLIKNLFK